MKFKVGDLVEWAGAPGKVTDVIKSKYSSGRSIVIVTFEEKKIRAGGPAFESEFQTAQFDPEGKLLPWHREASLKHRKA